MSLASAAPPGGGCAAPDAAVPGRLRRAGRSLALLGLAALAFVVATRALRATLPLPADAGMRLKWELLERHADEAQVVVLGSSYTLCSIVPDVVERVLAERGHPLRVLNLGVPGLLPQEADHLLARLVADPPRGLRFLALELRGWRPAPHTRVDGERSVVWHTPVATLAALRAERDAGMTANQRFDALGIHAELAGRHLTNLGRLSTIGLHELGMLAVDEEWMTPAVVARERGYVALEEVVNPGAARGSRRFHADPAAWELMVRALARANEAPAEPEPWNAAPLRRRLELMREAPFEVTHLVGPFDVPSAPFRALVERGEMPPFWAFDDPRAHPGLYDLEARYDSRHLTRAGAEQFSRLFAARLADHLDGVRNTP